VFSYRASEWHNPFKVSEREHTLHNSLLKFEKHLSGLLKDSEARERFLKLREAKEIGCFCASGSPCHRDIILKILRQMSDSSAQ
jgi:hypothetical protein